MAGTAVATIRDSLENARANLATLLPATIPPEKFLRIAYDAINRNPELKQCTPQSVVNACSQAAKDQLVLDGREAALVIYNKREKQGNQWVTVAREAQYIPMVLGLRKRMYATGQISTMETGIVYQGEMDDGRFEWQTGTDGFLSHRPLLTDDLGPPIAAYSVVSMSNGTKSVEVMRWSEVMKVATLQSKNHDGKGNLKGIWAQHTNEMARKTVLRRHSKQLPFDSDLATMFERVDGLYGGIGDGAEDEPEDAQNAPPRKQAGAGKEKLRKARQERAQQETPERQPDVTDLEPVNEDGEVDATEEDDRI